MIPKKHSELVFGVLTAFFMSMMMSLFMTVVNIGWIEHMLAIWIRSWAIAFVTVFILSAITLPQIKKLVNKITY